MARGWDMNAAADRGDRGRSVTPIAWPASKARGMFLVPMKRVSLASFIHKNRAQIVKEWETFARSIARVGPPMSAPELRDHADEILTAIVEDMAASQSAKTQAEKSKGHGEAGALKHIGKIHAVLRIDNGFKLAHMVAEYRALRASVLRLWEDQSSDPAGVTRFNEAIDEALTEAVTTFADTTDAFRDEALGILGHDLRNPLSTIVMASSSMLASDELDDGDRRMLTRIASGAAQMTRILGDLTDLTQTRFGEAITIKRKTFDLQRLCEAVVADANAREGGSIPAVTFSASGDLRGEWDVDRIKQALANLIVNAVSHRGSGKVEVLAEGAGPEVVVSVCNGGEPIAPDLLGRILEPHVRRVAGPTERRLGLGLYVTAQIMIAHGGKLTVTSTADAGTTFSLSLPRVVATTPAQKPEKSR